MTCKQIKADGEKCKANAMTGKEYCYLHSPEIPEDEKKENQSKGGKNKNKPLRILTEPVTLENGNDVMILIGDMVNNVLQGKMDINTGKGVTYMLSYHLKAYELAELEKRIENLERGNK